MSMDITELERRLSNLIRIGTIEAADYDNALVLVDCNGVSTNWLPWMTRRAGGDLEWWAPEVGEQVLVIAPSGLLEAAVVLPALYSSQHPEPSKTPNIHRINYANGDSIEHNRATGAWSLNCSGQAQVKAGTAVIDSPSTSCTGDLTVAGALTVGKGASITGDTAVTGNINAGGSIIDAGGNSNHHSH